MEELRLRNSVDSSRNEPPPSLEAAPIAIRTNENAWEKALPDLMIRYQAGDVAAVEELVRQLSRVLLQFLSAFGLAQPDAEDLLQECWMRIHKSRHTYRPSEPVLPWVLAIARHTRLDGYRRRRRREAREISMASPDTHFEAPNAGATDQHEFNSLLQSLPASQREVILMLKVSGMSLEEVARATSSTVGAVKQKAHRAYEKLRSVLKKESV